jgi:hypothetical protein
MEFEKTLHKEDIKQYFSCFCGACKWVLLKPFDKTEQHQNPVPCNCEVSRKEGRGERRREEKDGEAEGGRRRRRKGKEEYFSCFCGACKWVLLKPFEQISGRGSGKGGGRKRKEKEEGGGRRRKEEEGRRRRKEEGRRRGRSGDIFSPCS